MSVAGLFRTGVFQCSGCNFAQSYLARAEILRQFPALQGFRLALLVELDGAALGSNLLPAALRIEVLNPLDDKQTKPSPRNTRCGWGGSQNGRLYSYPSVMPPHCCRCACALSITSLPRRSYPPGE